MPRRIEAKGDATKYRLNDECVQALCCVFIGMDLSMLLCFHWNVSNVYIYVQMLSDYTLI